MPFGPGRPILEVGQRLEYFPYGGVEYFNNLAIKDDDGGVIADAFSGTFGTLRLTVQLLPLSTRAGANRRVQVSGSYTHRFRIGGTDAIDDELGSFSGSAIIWFNAGETIGLAYTYDEGETPDNNFRPVSKSAVTLTFKMN